MPVSASRPAPLRGASLPSADATEVTGKRTRPDGLRRALRWAAIGVPALVLMWAGWARRWTTDDGFINFRIVHLLVAGHGPVFNVGERVETYTSPLWLGILALGDLLLPLRLEYVAIALSIPLAGLGVLAMGSGARRLWQQPGDRWWLPFGTLVVLAIAPMWDFTTSGLEFGVTLAWLGGVTWVLGRWADADRRLTWGEALLVGLGPLVRPDTTVYTLAVLALVIAVRWRAESWRDRFVVLATALGLPVLYELFRMAYFAALVPNTAIAKGADSSHWHAGWLYLRNLVGTYQLLIPLAIVLVAGFLVARDRDLRHRGALVVLPVTALVQTLGIVHSGGDYIHARLLLPAVVAFVAPLAVLPARRALLVPVAALAIWAVVAATSLRMEGSVVAGRSLIANGHDVASGSTKTANPVTAEQNAFGRVPAYEALSRAGSGIFDDLRPVDLVPKPGVRQPLTVMAGVGVGGYTIGGHVYVLDRLGLGDALTARLKVARQGFIGHEKVLPEAWILARVTDQDVSTSKFHRTLFGTELYASPPGRLASDARVAREVLRCKALTRLQHAISDPLTFGRAMRNIGESFSLTRLKVPPQPEEAKRKLC